MPTSTKSPFVIKITASHHIIEVNYAQAICRWFNLSFFLYANAVCLETMTAFLYKCLREQKNQNTKVGAHLACVTQTHVSKGWTY